MRLKPYLKSAARRALSLLVVISFTGCTFSTKPTYVTRNIEENITNICKKEYIIDVKVKLIGKTLWVYLPLENIFTSSEKPEKYMERFAVEQSKAGIKDATLEVEYLVKTVPEQEKSQQVKYTDETSEKINRIWRVLRRVLFSLDTKSQSGIEFFCLIIADTANGFEVKNTFYYIDIKKVSYEYIGQVEYQHRTLQDVNVSPEIIADKQGLHIKYKDITLKDFVVSQIEHRIKLKFQKPEVERNADIEKEILKVIIHTLKIYNFRDFSSLELNNAATKSKTILNQAALWDKIID